MAYTGILKQYDTTGLREDLTDGIFLVAREETPFVSTIAGRTTATQKLHEWQTVDLATPVANNAIAEDGNFSTASNTTTNRLQNYTQMSDKVAKVTLSNQATQAAGRSDEMAMQLKYKGIELARDIEAACISNNNYTAGSTGSPTRVTRGLEAWISTNVDQAADGSTSAGVVTDGTKRDLTKDMIDQQLRGAYQNGGRPKTLMCGTSMKIVLDRLLTNTNTRWVAADEREVVSSVDVYYGPFGAITIMPNYVQDAIGRGNTLYGLEGDKWAVAYLQPVQTKDVPPSGYWVGKALMAEYALESRNEKASFKIADVNNA